MTKKMIMLQHKPALDKVREHKSHKITNKLKNYLNSVKTANKKFLTFSLPILSRSKKITKSCEKNKKIIIQINIRQMKNSNRNLINKKKFYNKKLKYNLPTKNLWMV